MQILNIRQNKMLEIIASKQTIDVNDLIAQVGASPATVRKDLTYLESEGYIERTWGEAHIINAPTEQFQPFVERSGKNILEKQQIAKEAIKYVNDGDTIILDDGTTTCEIAKLLGEFKSLKVITNSIDIVKLLSQNREITLMIPGGVVNCETQSLIGPDTERFFDSIEADKMFLSVAAVRGLSGFAVNLPFEATIKQKSIKAARKKIAVFDSSKFFCSALTLFADFGDVDIIISNKCNLEKATISAIERSGAELILL